MCVPVALRSPVFHCERDIFSRGRAFFRARRETAQFQSRIAMCTIRFACRAIRNELGAAVNAAYTQQGWASSSWAMPENGIELYFPNEALTVFIRFDYLHHHLLEFENDI